MPIYLSKLFAPVLKQAPADAVLKSDALLTKAGYVRKSQAGVFSMLPLGVLVQNRIEAKVREVMERVGAQELSLPALQPETGFAASNRLEAFGSDMFSLEDRKNSKVVLAPTHEEAFTSLVKENVTSYREFPFILYQVGSKFRDEVRPRGGLLRGREFKMKDAYSFNLDQAGLEETYAVMRAAYKEIFDSIGIEYVVVKADSGVMGGAVNEEFLAICEDGEDTFVHCSSCGYAANIEVTGEAASCPDCGQAVETLKGIEIGHIFQLGTQYSKPLGLTITGSSGAALPVLMGSYGIGISRLMAVAVEQFHDELGITWPVSLAPVQLHLVPTTSALLEVAIELAKTLEDAGFTVLVDDREVSPGAKFMQADMIGSPTRITVGRDWVDGVVEVRDRASGSVEKVALGELVARLKERQAAPRILRSVKTNTTGKAIA